MNLIPVGCCEVKFSNDPEAVLVAHSLGSCVGVALWDHEVRAGGMAHVFLPHKSGDVDESPGRYGDTAVAHLVKGLIGLGCKKQNLRAWLAGGANVLPGLASTVGDVGAMNARAVREALRKEGISVAGEDLGGNCARTMRLYIGTGKVEVYSAHDGTTSEI